MTFERKRLHPLTLPTKKRRGYALNVTTPLRLVRASATICSLNSAGYGFLGLGIRTLSSHCQNVSIKPGEFQRLKPARRLSVGAAVIMLPLPTA
jgi:hypothetical protein